MVSLRLEDGTGAAPMIAIKAMDDAPRAEGQRGDQRALLWYARERFGDARIRHQVMLYLMHQSRGTLAMRTTVNLDESLLAEARRLSGLEERSALLHEALRALIARESARRLARLGGSEPRLKTIPRRRSGGR